MMENSNRNAPPHTPETEGGFATRDPRTLYNKILRLVKDLISAYKFAFMDLSKEYPMPFEDYDEKSYNIKTGYLFFQDRRKYYV